QPGGILIQTAHRKEPTPDFPQVLVDGLAARRIAVAGDDTLGFVEEQINLARRLETIAVEPDHVAPRLDPGFRIAHNAAVHPQSPGENGIARRRSRSKAVARKNSVECHGRLRFHSLIPCPLSSSPMPT